jgi:cytochrome P450
MIARGPTAAEAQALIEVGRDLAYAELVARYGPNFRLRGALVTADAQVAQTLLTDRAHTRHRSVIYRLMARLIPGAEGPLFQDGARWERSARAVMPVFSRANVRRYAEAIHGATLGHIASWRHGRTYPDLFGSLCELGAAVALQVGFGLDPASDLGRRLSAALIRYKALTMGTDHRLDTLGLHRGHVRMLPGLIRNIGELERQMRHIQALVDEAECEAPYDPERPNWMRGLIDAGLPPRELADTLNHLYGAYNAIDFILSCACHELSRAPALTETLREELLTTLGPDTPATLEDLPRLPGLRAFLRECLRRYPVAMGVMRRTGAPLQVDGETMPPGTEVIILISALHHRPDYWDAPERFEPGRWAAGDTPRVPFSYIPFLAGPRQCLGRRLAELNFVAVLGALLRSCSLELPLCGARITPYLIPRWDRPLPFIVRRYAPVGRPVERALV